ncbi:MAG TPA: hypothetical protein VH023_06265, partial [Rhodopila sp.]|nr:hypothetical protein [Rhodopila sp.]
MPHVFTMCLPKVAAQDVQSFPRFAPPAKTLPVFAGADLRPLRQDTAPAADFFVPWQLRRRFRFGQLAGQRGDQLHELAVRHPADRFCDAGGKGWGWLAHKIIPVTSMTQPRKNPNQPGRKNFRAWRTTASGPIARCILASAA